MASVLRLVVADLVDFVVIEWQGLWKQTTAPVPHIEELLVANPVLQKSTTQTDTPSMQ
jgi:hypothetical protein